MKEISKDELARALGKHPRTIQRWLPECPHRRDKRDGTLYFVLEKVVAWRAQQEEGSHSSVASEGDQRSTLARAELARKLSVAKKNELELNAERALKGLRLDTKIREAKTYEDLARVSKEAGALVASTVMSPARGQAIQRLLAEARQNLKAHEDAGGNDDPRLILLINAEERELLEAFQGIICDERRARIVEHVHEELKVDEVENPNVDLTELHRTQTDLQLIEGAGDASPEQTGAPQ